MATITRADGGERIDVERCRLVHVSHRSEDSRDWVTFWVPAQLAQQVVPGLPYDLVLDDGRAVRTVLGKAITSSAIPGLAMYRGEVEEPRS